MNKAKLLEVLDMSEDKQWEWICKNHFVWSEWDHNWYYGKQIICCIADLAFRLRDEAKSEVGFAERYYTALEDIYKYRKIQKQCQSFNAWITYQLSPTDMVIAVLIAKGD